MEICKLSVLKCIHGESNPEYQVFWSLVPQLLFSLVDAATLRIKSLFDYSARREENSFNFSKYIFYLINTFNESILIELVFLIRYA